LEERWKAREEEGEDISSYGVTLRKKYWNLKKKH
jgi:hypothetical protein